MKIIKGNILNISVYKNMTELMESMMWMMNLERNRFRIKCYVKGHLWISFDDHRKVPTRLAGF